MAYSAEGRAPYSQFGLLCNGSRFVGNTSVTGLEKVCRHTKRIPFSRSRALYARNKHSVRGVWFGYMILNGRREGTTQ